MTEDIVIQGSNKIPMKLTPKEVIDSLKKRFPNAKAVQFYKTTPQTIKNGWVVNQEDNMTSTSELDSYTLSFTRDDFQYYALFDAHGKLLMSKYEEYDASVPQAVKTALINHVGKNYKDYQVTSKNYYKRVNNDNHKEYYEVKAVNKKNKNDTKMFRVAPDGTILKSKG